MTERGYCRCGAVCAVTSDPDTTARVLALWRSMHKGPRHGHATQQQAANARRVQTRALARRRGQ